VPDSKDAVWEEGKSWVLGPDAPAHFHIPVAGSCILREGSTDDGKELVLDVQSWGVEPAKSATCAGDNGSGCSANAEAGAMGEVECGYGRCDRRRQHKFEIGSILTLSCCVNEPGSPCPSRLILFP